MRVMVNYKLRRIKDVYDELPEPFKLECDECDDSTCIGRETGGITTLSNQGPEKIDRIISHNSGKNVYRISTEHCSVDVLESQQVVVFLDCDLIFIPANELQVGDIVMDIYDDMYQHSPITSIENLGPSNEPVYGVHIDNEDRVKNILFANKILICGVEPYI